MGNSEWEYQNQETLKAWYQEKISGKNPNLAVRRIICKGCGREFTRRSSRKSIAIIISAEIEATARNCHSWRVKHGKTAFVRSAARYLRLQDRTMFIAPTLADRKPTVKVLRITK